MDWKIFYDSYYYKYVLNPYDRETFRALTRNTLTRTNKYYSNGMLVVNAKIRTICFDSGITYSTTKKSLNKLEKLGLIVKAPKKSRNDRFLLGFRGKSDEKYYLAWYLVEKYDPFLEAFIEDQKKEDPKKKIKRKWHLPKLIDVFPYKLETDYKHFIFDYFDNPAVLINRQIKDGKNISELLFGIDNVFRQTLLEVPQID
jgi:hypothetical protein